MCCCEGDFTAEDITLVGAFVANSVSSAGSEMRMNRVNLVSVPTMTKFSFKPKVGFWRAPRIDGLKWRFESTATLEDDFVDAGAGEDGPRYTDRDLKISKAKMVYIIDGKPRSRSLFLERVQDIDLPADHERSQACVGMTDWDSYLECEEQAILRVIREQIELANEEYRKYRDAAVWAGEFQVDLNRFITIEDRVRLVLFSESSTK